MRVLISDQVFPDIEVETQLLTEAGHTLEVATSPEHLAAMAPHADAILTTFSPFPADFLANLPKTKIIARYGIGVDNVDLAAATSHGIIVTNVPDYCVEEVAAHATAMALSLLRNLQKADTATREGLWGVSSVRPLHRISTLTIGLLGYGRIGRMVAATMATFGCRVIAHDPYATLPESVESVDLDQLISRSNVLFLHAPLTPETRGIINAERLNALPAGALLINAARGPLVVLEDVVAALISGHLGGAGLDTFPVEPLDSSLLDGVPNLLLSPHTAYYSEEAIRESQHKATTQVIKVLAGKPADYQVNK